MEDCLFCKIAAGELPAHKIYEDELAFAFLDKHPINPGHILVIPKEHRENFYDLSDPVYQTVFETAKRLAQTVSRKMNPKKVGLVVAGWDVPHAHIHIVPMQDYHDITSKSVVEGNRANPEDAELGEVAALLREGF